MGKKLAGVVIAVPIALLLALLTLLGGAWFGVSQTLGDCGSMRLDAYEAQARGDTATANYRLQEAEVCSRPGGGRTETPSPRPTTPLTTSSTSTPTQTPRVRQWEFLANRPAPQKIGLNSFGPKQAMTVKKELENLTTSEAIKEFKHRLIIDPMLTAATGATAGLWGYDQVDKKTGEFANNHTKWDEANVSIFKWIDGAKAGVGTFKSGNYGTFYAIPGKVPSVRAEHGAYRNGEAYLAINGKVFRLACGFQEHLVGRAPSKAERMPAPSSGMARDNEGNPTRG